MSRVVVIGAGIGGLASAVLLANRGLLVTVVEKNATVGGKMNRVISNGYTFDTGPSLLTMPFLLEQLFDECGQVFDDFLQIEELDPLCRYTYSDGTTFDNYSDRKKSVQEIATFAPSDTENYLKFLDRAEQIYNKTADAFLFNPLYSFGDFLKVNPLKFLGIDAFSTVAHKVDDTVNSPYLRQFFKRFTTYNGSSPFRAPATLNVIPHVELNQGGYYVRGGLYRIAEALYELAIKLGVDFTFSSEVNSITIENKKVKQIVLKTGSVIACDLLFSNSDATETLVKLLPDGTISQRKKEKQKNIEPSCSGFVLLLGCNRKWENLIHHNIFFSSNYEQEFADIFERKMLPDEPTIYVANSSFTDTHHAPENASNLFVLVNAPYLHNSQNWEEITPNYANKIIDILQKSGLEKLRESIEFQQIITPEDFYAKYRSNKGSIYGTSSNDKFSAFLRPRNKSREIDNLYLVGGSTHPGGGIPLVLQSAFNAVTLFDRDRRN